MSFGVKGQGFSWGAGFYVQRFGVGLSKLEFQT